MYINGSTHRTSADFDNALLFQIQIEVYQQNEPIDRRGIKEAFTNHFVIDGATLQAVYSRTNGKHDPIGAPIYEWKI